MPGLHRNDFPMGPLDGLRNLANGGARGAEDFVDELFHGRDASPNLVLNEISINSVEGGPFSPLGVAAGGAGGDEPVPLPSCSLMHRSLTCIADGERIMVRDAHTNKLVSTLKGHTSTILCMCAGESENVFFSGDKEGFIRKWDVSTSEMLLKSEGHSKMVTSLAFCAEDNTVYSGSADRTVKKWKDRAVPEDLAGPQPHGHLRGGLPHRERGLQRVGRQDGEEVARQNRQVASNDGGHQMPVTNIQVRDKDNLVLTAEWGGRRCLRWDLSTGAMLEADDTKADTTILML